MAAATLRTSWAHDTPSAAGAASEAAPHASQTQIQATTVTDELALPRRALLVGGHRIVVEIAADPASQSRGLMFRKQLPKDHGMLFVFENAEQRCFWMKNTPLPLTIAFIDDSGTLINLADMQPYSRDTHCSLAPARYALEMEQGWFKRHGVGPGTKISEPK